MLRNERHCDEGRTKRANPEPERHSEKAKKQGPEKAQIE